MIFGIVFVIVLLVFEIIKNNLLVRVKDEKFIIDVYMWECRMIFNVIFWVEKWFNVYLGGFYGLF